MGTNNFIPTIWSTLLNNAFQKSFVYASCVNSDYEGEIRNYGDKVKINEISDISVGNYTKDSTSITYENLDDASQILEIDQSKYFAFKVDDVDKIQQNPKLLEKAVKKAGEAVRDTVDQYIVGIMAASPGITTGLGTSGTPIEINSENVGVYLLKIARLLDDNNVTRNGRFVVIPPFMLEDLVLAGIADATDNMNYIENGFVTKYAGFDIRLSTNVPNTEGAKYQIVAGVDAATTFAGQASMIEHLRLENSFHDAVRGLYLYASKVVKPDGLALMYANEAAES